MNEAHVPSSTAPGRVIHFPPPKEATPLATATADKLPPAAYRAILDLTATEEERDEANLLGKGFLRRRQGMLFIGATGIGKSSNLVQGQINWALGKPHFGIKPQRELTSLYV